MDGWLHFHLLTLKKWYAIFIFKGKKERGKQPPWFLCHWHFFGKALLLQGRSDLHLFQADHLR
jgi:hypothetical protein